MPSRPKRAPSESPATPQFIVPWQSQRTPRAPRAEPLHRHSDLPPITSTPNNPVHARFQATPRFRTGPTTPRLHGEARIETWPPPSSVIPESGPPSVGEKNWKDPILESQESLDNNDDDDTDWENKIYHDQEAGQSRKIVIEPPRRTIDSHSEGGTDIEDEASKSDGVDESAQDSAGEFASRTGSRVRKRRRISISSIPSSPSEGMQVSSDGDDHEDDDDNDGMQTIDQAIKQSKNKGYATMRAIREASINTAVTATIDYMNAPKPLFPFMRSAIAQNLAFDIRPQFKPDANAARSGALDDVPPAALLFSPHRRGSARYVPGGLAAGLQAWLGEVNTEWEAGQQMRGGMHGKVISASQVRGNRDMVAVCGQVLAEGGGSGAERSYGCTTTTTTTTTARAVLVKQQRGRSLEEEGGNGSRREDEVRKGSVVGTRQPYWDVDLVARERGGGGVVRWTVCCDWSLVPGREDMDV